MSVGRALLLGVLLAGCAPVPQNRVASISCIEDVCTATREDVLLIYRGWNDMIERLRERE